MLFCFQEKTMALLAFEDMSTCPVAPRHTFFSRFSCWVCCWFANKFPEKKLWPEQSSLGSSWLIARLPLPSRIKNDARNMWIVLGWLLASRCLWQVGELLQNGQRQKTASELNAAILTNQCCLVFLRLGLLLRLSVWPPNFVASSMNRDRRL